MLALFYCFCSLSLSLSLSLSRGLSFYSIGCPGVQEPFIWVRLVYTHTLSAVHRQH